MSWWDPKTTITYGAAVYVPGKGILHYSSSKSFKRVKKLAANDLKAFEHLGYDLKIRYTKEVKTVYDYDR